MKIGKIVKGTGRVLGTVAEFNIKITGEVIGAVADIANKPKIAEGSRNFTRVLGDVVGDTTRVASDFTGNVIDKAIDTSVKTVKKIENAVVKENVTEINEKGEIKNKVYINGVDYKIVE